MSRRRAPSPPESAAAKAALVRALEGPRTWRFGVDGHPLSPNRAATASLRARLRDKKHYREAVAWEVRQQYRGVPLQRARVTVTLVRRDSQFYDSDNAVATCKRLCDGLVVGGLLADDGPAHMELVVRQERGSHRKVEIVVEEVA